MRIAGRRPTESFLVLLRKMRKLCFLYRLIDMWVSWRVLRIHEGLSWALPALWPSLFSL